MAPDRSGPLGFIDHNRDFGDIRGLRQAQILRPGWRPSAGQVPPESELAKSPSGRRERAEQRRLSVVWRAILIRHPELRKFGAEPWDKVTGELTREAYDAYQEVKGRRPKLPADITSDQELRPTTTGGPLEGGVDWNVLTRLESERGAGSEEARANLLTFERYRLGLPPSPEAHQGMSLAEQNDLTEKWIREEGGRRAASPQVSQTPFAAFGRAYGEVERDVAEPGAALLTEAAIKGIRTATPWLGDETELERNTRLRREAGEGFLGARTEAFRETDLPPGVKGAAKILADPFNLAPVLGFPGAIARGATLPFRLAGRMAAGPGVRQAGQRLGVGPDRWRKYATDVPPRLPPAPEAQQVTDLASIPDIPSILRASPDIASLLRERGARDLIEAELRRRPKSTALVRLEPSVDDMAGRIIESHRALQARPPSVDELASIARRYRLGLGSLPTHPPGVLPPGKDPVPLPGSGLTGFWGRTGQTLPGGRLGLRTELTPEIEAVIGRVIETTPNRTNHEAVKAQGLVAEKFAILLRASDKKTRREAIRYIRKHTGLAGHEIENLAPLHLPTAPQEIYSRGMIQQARRERRRLGLLGEEVIPGEELVGGVADVAPITPATRAADEALPVGTRGFRAEVGAIQPESGVKSWSIKNDGSNAGLRLKDDGEGYIWGLKTPEPFQRQGFAEALIRSGIKLLSDNGATTIRAHSTAAGRAVFKKLGFKETGFKTRSVTEYVLDGSGIEKLLDDIEAATARGKTYSGARTLVPRYVSGEYGQPGKEFSGKGFPKNASILDFGAGEEAVHTNMLREQGYTNVTAYERKAGFTEGVHDPDALSRKYDVVMASNVLNVQTTKGRLDTTLRELADSVAPGGKVVANYPNEPRLMTPKLTVADLKTRLKGVFNSVEEIRGGSAPIYELSDPIGRPITPAATGRGFAPTGLGEVAAGVPVRELVKEAVPATGARTALREIEGIIARVPGTSHLEGSLAEKAQGVVGDRFRQLVGGEVVPSKNALYKYIAAHTKHDIEDLKDLVGRAQQELLGEAGKPPPLATSVSRFENSVRESVGTFGRILRETVPGEKVDQGLLVRLESATGEAADVVRQKVEEGSKRLERLGVGRWYKGHYVIKDTEIPEMDLLFEALHNPSLVESGVLRVPAKYMEDYRALRELTNWEEAAAIKADPSMLTIEDYFYRGWAVPKAARRAISFLSLGGRIGKRPSFRFPRTKASYREMRDKGFEPMSWNPYEVWAHRARMGVRNRLQKQLVDDFKNIGVAIGEAAEGRVPRIGPAFEGRLVVTPSGIKRVGAIKVPNAMADRLENAFGAVPRLRLAVPTEIPKIGGLGLDLIPLMDAVIYPLKQAKLMGSIFQQRDLIQRVVSGTFTSVFDELKRGRPIGALKEFAVLPKAVYEILQANLSPGVRKNLAEWYRSDVPFDASRPGITPAALRRAGLSTFDVTYGISPDLDKIPRALAAEYGLMKNRKIRELVVNLENSIRRGLFEGAWPAAIKADLTNNSVPMFLKSHGHLSDEQLAGLIAREINKAYSAIPASQSVIQTRWLRATLLRFFFSLGENEGFIRQTTGAIRGPSAGYWRKRAVGTWLSLMFIANMMHWARTRELLPWERWSPITQDEYSPLPFNYNRDFAAPNVPVQGRSGEDLTLDLVGQFDTVVRMLNPLNWLKARPNVPIRAIMNQVTGTNFYNEYINQYGPNIGPIDGIISRTAQAIQDLFVPIGAGEAVVGELRERVPGLKRVMPSAGATLGTGGRVAKALAGGQLGAQTKPEIENLMVERAIQADPVGAEEMNIAPGQSYRGLAEGQKNFVAKQPVNQRLVEELGLREQEQKARKLDPVPQWFVEQDERRVKYHDDLEGFALESKDKQATVQKFWYRKKAEKRTSKFYDIEADKVAEGKRDLGDDFMASRIPEDATPELLMEKDLYKLLYADDPDSYAKYFPGEKLVPLEEMGSFNILEYNKRKEAINAAAVEAGMGERFAERTREEVLSRRGAFEDLPKMEVERLRARAYIADNYWSIGTSTEILQLFPNENVKAKWLEYVTMPTEDRTEEDKNPESIAAKHKFKKIYSGRVIRGARIMARMSDDVLERLLVEWGYVTKGILEHYKVLGTESTPGFLRAY